MLSAWRELAGRKVVFNYIRLENELGEIEDKLRLNEAQKLSIALEKLIADFKKIKNEFNNRNDDYNNDKNSEMDKDI